MNELLNSKGWKMYYSCKVCGGNKKYYNNDAFPGYDVRVRIRRNGNIFTIVHNNKTISGPDWVLKLEEKLKAHGIWKTI